MAHIPLSENLLYKVSAYFDRADKMRFLRFVLVSQLPAIFELSVAAIIALVAAVFSSPEKVIGYPPMAYIIKHTGFTFLSEQSYLAFTLLVILWLAMILKNVTNMLQAYMGAIFAEHCSRKLTLSIMRLFLDAPWHWHLTKNVVDLNFSFTSAQQVGNLLTILSQAIANASVVFFLFAGLLIASPGLSLGLFTIAGASALCIFYGIKRFFDNLNNIVYTKRLNMDRISYFALHGMKEARIHNREDAIYKDYSVRSADIMHAKAQQVAFSRLPISFIEITAFLMLPVMMYILLEIQGASMTRVVAIMGFLAGAAWRVLPAVNRLVDNAMQLRTFTPYLNNILGRLQEQKEFSKQTVLPSAQNYLSFVNTISIDNISFTYPTKTNPALSNISITIPKGSMLGIVGLSGAGKSTLVAILTGLLQPSAGEIKLDDTVLSPAILSLWRKKIGYVPQSPFIFNDSIAANIGLSDWGRTIDYNRVNECCALAALDFIDDLDDGINTIVGDRGINLSGGQAQRLAIARALYDKPEILIFDEATSSLDMKNERAIHETVLKLRNNITMIIVAHRLSTVEECDHIVWLDKGQVYTQGAGSQILKMYQEAMKQTEAFIPQ